MLNDYYKRAVFYEFDINQRDDDFLKKWSMVCIYSLYLIAVSSLFDLQTNSLSEICFSFK